MAHITIWKKTAIALSFSSLISTIVGYLKFDYSIYKGKKFYILDREVCGTKKMTT